MGAEYSAAPTALLLQMKPRGRTKLPTIARRVVTALTSFLPSPNRGKRLQPERRSGVRIVTLKNAGWLALSLTVLFVLFSAYMERRSRGTSSYGRLYDERIDAAHAPATTTTASSSRP